MADGAAGRIALVSMVACISAASASAQIAAPEWLQGRLFSFSGFDAGLDCVSEWTGLVVAPFGRLDEDGLRVRLFAGHGDYRYRTTVAPSGENRGHGISEELLIGQRFTYGATIIVAYLGSETRFDLLRWADPKNPAQGFRFGAKALVEIYTRLLPGLVATASFSASTVDRAYTARTSLAYELISSFRVGAEAALFGDARYDEKRFGLLTRFPLWESELTLSGGVLENSGKGRGLYSTLSVYIPF